MKRLGIIADTHDRWDEKIETIFAGVDHILHAGDVCQENILDQLRAIAPLTVVMGNNDFLPGYRETERREFQGFRFFMIHILPAPSRMPTG